MTGGTIAEARRKRWWQDGPPLRSLEEAQEYIEDVGICLLFGGAAARYPSLREVSRDESLPRLPSGWGQDLEAMWTWKDTLPVKGGAWLGRYLSGKQTLLSCRLLADLYEFEGEEDDVLSAAGLSEEAGRLAGLLLDEGPMSTRALREAVGVTGKRFDQVLTELGRRLLITNYGVEEGPGWASCVIELTARAFSVPSGGSRAERDALAAARFADTMVEAKPAAVCRAFGWSRERAVAALES
ncbi:AlkZ-related protein [Streptomyces chromofuscus]|uniref:Winged helix DNA-binding domain-containing protein n=1 Tax=Streptomyces chromofuscus TaxID=42881 RepID=A0A7M2T3T6_STRCW|nr:hypothetical protein [Streptomyces chromofuscus]QOV42151.1 hypothetical protein IPT68_20065 [Streptomyces chromofuscus]GGS85132.1 hypothetical protein GCM10010254_01030 [Streptomyces chromofuscus]